MAPYTEPLDRSFILSRDNSQLKVEDTLTPLDRFAIWKSPGGICKPYFHSAIINYRLEPVGCLTHLNSKLGLAFLISSIQSSSSRSWAFWIFVIVRSIDLEREATLAWVQDNIYIYRPRTRGDFPTN